MKRKINDSRINFNPKLRNSRIKQYLIRAGEIGHKSNENEKHVFVKLLHFLIVEKYVLAVITLHYVISNANYTYSDQWCINKSHSSDDDDDGE